MKIEDAASRRRNIARQIAQAMEAKGISRSRLAQLMGKTPPYVTAWLSGEHNFTSDTLAQLSQTLGVNITGVEDDREYSFIDSGIGRLCDSSVMASVPMGNVLRDAVLRRAYVLGKSVDEYVIGLIRKDLDSSVSLPKVKVTEVYSGKVRKYDGILKNEPLSGDDRFDRIWNR